jgi:hypothetical protein
MKTKLFGGANKINIDSNYDDNEDNEDEDYEETNDNNKKLHINVSNEELALDDEEIISHDDKIIVNTHELVMDENQLQEILELNTMEEVNLNSSSLKQELLDEIKNISLENSETILETNIEAC